MRPYYYLRLLLLLFLPGISLSSIFCQSKGLKAISEKELKFHVDFLGAPEFRGRETPSPELEIASLYLANCFRNAGFGTIMPDGSFYQVVPLDVASISSAGTRLRIEKDGREEVFSFGKDFTGNFQESGSYSGSIVFAGAGISEPDKGWDDLGNMDISGKVVVIIDELRPRDKIPVFPGYSRRIGPRLAALREHGAAAVLVVMSDEQNARMASGQNVFDYIPTGRLPFLYDSRKTFFDPESKAAPSSGRPSLPFAYAEISRKIASSLLGLGEDQLSAMHGKIREGVRVPGFEVKNTRVQIDVKVDHYKSSARNVIALIEGKDPVLKNEYIVVSGHHDGRGIDDGEVIPGADDNVTAVVALIEIGKALMAERPARSVILAAFAGEEQGMHGSHYFINNCPVPVEKISTCLNMDMIGRNTSDSLFLVGSDLLSSQLDAAINKSNRQARINFGFDYRYSNLTHPDQVYFRSDHYPFMRFGIPSVWFFSGFTPDYHTPRDIPEKINYEKFLKITKLVYVTAFNAGNMPGLLKLDVNPAVTQRGKMNLRERSLFSDTEK